MVEAVKRQGERDLVVDMIFQGDAGLDLAVTEPSGTVCSFMQRQTAGGGILLGGNVSDRTHESYVAAKAFTGEYKITLRRIWGRPLGGKATVEIIQHQGTPQESRRRETIVFDRSRTLTFVLDEGRRTSAEYVPPPSARETRRKPADPQSGDAIFSKLRALADPELVGGESGLRGGLASLGIQAPSKDLYKTPARGQSDVLTYQTKVTPLAANSVDFTMETTISPDQRTARVKLAPIFQSVHQAPMPSFSNPLIPGGGDPSP